MTLVGGGFWLKVTPVVAIGSKPCLCGGSATPRLHEICILGVNTIRMTLVGGDLRLTVKPIIALSVAIKNSAPWQQRSIVKLISVIHRKQHGPLTRRCGSYLRFGLLPC